MNRTKFKSICTLIKLTIEEKKSISEFNDELSRLQPGENINSIYNIDREECTLLEYAVDKYLTYMHENDKAFRIKEIIKKLLEHKSNPDIHGKNMPILLQIAGHPLTSEATIYKESTQLLSMVGRLSAYRNKCIDAMLELIDLLYLFEADFSVRDRLGNNAIHTAVMRRNYDLIATLHSNGCGLNCFNKGFSGKGPETPYDTLLKMNDRSSEYYLDIIEKLGAKPFGKLKPIRYEKGYFFESDCKLIDESEIQSTIATQSMDALFNDPIKKTFIQSNFPGKKVREWLAVADKLFLEKEQEAKQIQGEQMKDLESSLQKLTVFAKPAPIKQEKSVEEKMSNAIAKIKQSCLFKKEELFRDAVNQLWELCGIEKTREEMSKIKLHAKSAQEAYVRYFTNYAFINQDILKTVTTPSSAKFVSR